MNNRYYILSSAIALAIMTTACGGGGGGSGGVKEPIPAPPTPPPPTPPPAPPAPPPPPPPTDPTPPTPPPARYTGFYDNLLVPTNVDLAHKNGYTGAGAKIGMLDDGRYNSPTLDGKVDFYYDFTNDPGKAEPDTNGKAGHGTVIANSIVGNSAGNFKGGIAPDADFYWGRMCYDNSCWSDAAARGATEMLKDGVRIFNLSIGSHYGDDVQGAKFSSDAWYSSFKEAIKLESLVVVSTGNDGKDSTGFPGGTPFYHPEAINNWIAVTAVDVNADGSVSNKSAYANGCGVAANWCMAAPGSIYVPAIAGTLFQNGAQGTSMATGVISGIAGLVSGAYPWMTGNNLQTTLFTTATDLGAKGVDSVFGWGMVNAEKAVMGPGMFDKTFNANVNDGGTYFFGNDINGTRGLVKEGNGTLVLSGNNTYAGDTLVKDGRFGFSGNTASNVVVQGGTYTSLGGKIGGDYSAFANATTEIFLGDPMLVTKNANLDGALRLFNPDADYTVAGREHLMRAANIQGVFSNTLYGSSFFWSATLDYSATDIYANLTRTSGAASASASGASQSIVDGAGQLDSAISVIDGKLKNGEIDYSDKVVGEIGAAMNGNSAALSTLTGQIHGTARTLSVNGAINTTRTLADRMPHLAGTESNTMWGSATHIDGDLKRSGYDSASYNQDELSFGVDIPFDNAVVGASINSGEVRADIASSNSAMESNFTGVSLYGVKPLGDAYVSGVLGYQKGDIETRRNVVVGVDTFDLSSKRDESVMHARVEAGYNMDNGLTPFAGLGHITHKQDGFAERGNSALGLSAGSDKVNLDYLDIGLRHRFTNNAWSFDSLVAYRNIFSGGDTSYDAWFTGLSDASFTIDGQSISKEAVRAMFGVTYAPSKKVSFFGNVGVEKASGENDNATAQVGVRMAF